MISLERPTKEIAIVVELTQIPGLQAALDERVARRFLTA